MAGTVEADQFRAGFGHPHQQGVFAVDGGVADQGRSGDFDRGIGRQFGFEGVDDRALAAGRVHSGRQFGFADIKRQCRRDIAGEFAGPLVGAAVAQPVDGRTEFGAYRVGKRFALAIVGQRRA